ncbi:MAG: BTAD domain-containing putative transcriptional regulator, partial [Alphaproteobacteria bacterium]
MASLQLSLLGGFQINGVSGPALRLPTRKSQALLAYLALNAGQTHSRDKLAALLWGASRDAHARASLRQALSRLRKALPPPGPSGLIANGDAISIDRSSFAVDAAEFERLAAQGTPDALENAAGLYCGDLLDGFFLNEEAFDEWLMIERERLRDIAHDVLVRLLKHCTATGAIQRGIQVARRLLAHDPLQEQVHRTLIRFYLYQDRHGAAIAQYRRCCRLLDRELGIEPDPETRRLHEEILHRRPATSAPENTEDAGAAFPTAADEPDETAATDAAGRHTAAKPVMWREVPRPPSKPSIAVMPFANLGGKPEERYFSDGITEEILTALARFRDICVIARNSSFSFRESTVPVQQIGRELGADYVVAGSARREQGHVRVTAQLVDTGTGHHLWAERYDRDLEDVFTIEDEVTGCIVATLVGRIQHERLAEATRKAPGSLEAYDCWLRGMNCLRETRRTSTLTEAREFFTKAVEIDPLYARAYAGLAMTDINEWACITWSPWNWQGDDALRNARRAVEIDETDHHTHCMLGVIHLFRREFDLAYRHLNRAVALNPNDATTLAHLALALPLLGDPDEGIAAGETALRLDPYHPDWYLASLGIAYFVGRRYEAAVAAMERVPDVFCDTRAYLAAAYAFAGRPGMARAHRDASLDRFRIKTREEPGLAAMTCHEWLLDINPYR